MKKNLADEIISNSSIISLETLQLHRSEDSKQSVLFICAMPEELEGFRKALVFMGVTYTAVHFKGGYYYSFEYNGIFCSAMAVGITYFNIGRLTKCLNQGEYDEVICFGTCAGISSQPIGEVVVSNNAKCNDLYLSNFGYIDGTVDKNASIDGVVGPLMISGSKFLSSAKEKEAVLKRFPGAYTFDMESFIYVNYFRALGIPFICMKAISDNGEEEPEGSFDENVEYVSSISAVYALRFIERSSVKDFINIRREK